jgi:hypothetical protein
MGAGGVVGLAAARQDEAGKPEAQDNPELARLYEQDQADRSPEEGQAIDWEAVSRRDREREARIKQLYEAGEVRTGKDYHRAAMVLQHAPKPEDYLLAHEFCVVALAKGERDARWLAAAAEDRFLMNINRPQRFGTQYRSSGPDEPVTLYEVGPGVTDELRREMGVPTLAQAREREAEMQRLNPGRKPSPKP